MKYLIIALVALVVIFIADFVGIKIAESKDKK